MNNADFHQDSPSLQLLGKEFIIVVVVVFSALSFTLGYFVGKSGVDRKTEARIEASEAVPAVQKPADLAPIPLQNPAATENIAPAVEAKTESAGTKPKAPLVISEEKQPAPAASTTTKAKAPPVITEEKRPAPAAVTPIKPKVNTAVQGHSQQAPADTAVSGTDNQESVPSQAMKSDEGPLYTVQLGAFSSLTEARNVKKKYSQKGLKISIITSVKEKNKKVYKVRAGEFRDRKKAEMLSLRLNKAGKLKTYITSMDE